MDMLARPAAVDEIVEFRGTTSLSSLRRGAKAVVTGVGSGQGKLSLIERRLLELGFNIGEQVEVIAETRPGRDPFVVRIGCTTLALRRREAETVWVDVVAG